MGSGILFGHSGQPVGLRDVVEPVEREGRVVVHAHVGGDLEGLLPVLHAEHVGDAHDVVVDVVADGRGVADLVLVALHELA